MKAKDTINSNSYWNARFAENWEPCQGPAQSRFFARLAIENLPRWLIDQLQREPMTLCDWGCAQGDGTDVWASYVDSDRITGVDFSAIAVEQAAQRYPAIRFLNQNWLEAQQDELPVFDVVFSSNTLEHFHRPYAVLKTLCRRATKALVLALPYREIDRHHEHFFTFLPDNIPTVIGGGFRLVWSRVVDCRQLHKTFWDGDQIVLVYAETSWLDSLGLTLQDFCIEQSGSAAEIASLNQAVAERDGQIVSLNQAVAERDGQISSLNQAVAERDGQIVSLNQAVTERDGQIASLNQAVAERDGQIASLNHAVAERDGQIANLNQAVTERDGQIASLNQALVERDGQIASLSQAVVDRDKWLEQYNQQITALKGSHSWKITSPLRVIGKALRKQYTPQRTSMEPGAAPAHKDYPLWRKRISYLTTRYKNGVQRHGLLRSLPLAMRAFHRLGSVWMEKQLRRKTYERRLRELRKIIIGHADFIDLFHVPMGWSTPLFQRFQHMSLQAAQLGGLALYGGHLQVDKDLFVFNRVEGNVIVFDALDDRVVQCVFDALSEVRQPKMLRLQSIDLATKISDLEHFIQDGITIVYEYIDEISEEITGAIPAFVIERHKWLLRNEAVFVVATSDRLFAEVNRYRTNQCILSTNGVDLPHWRKIVPHPPADMEPALASGRIIVGYHGALAKWIDYELLKKIAIDGRFELVLIGYAHDDSLELSGILDISNVHFLGSKSYFVFNEYAIFYDIGILPFKRNELTESVSPVKLFEYMAASKPVVTTHLPECVKYKSCLISDTHDDFLKNLATAAVAGGDSAYMAALANDAEKNSWAEKATSVYQLAGIRAVKS